MAGGSTAERALLALVSAVFVAGVVAAVAMQDDSSPAGSSPGSSPTPGVTRPPAGSPPAVAVSVSGRRITSYARGSHQLVVSVQAKGARSAALQVAGRRYALRVVGDQVSGTVPVSCTGPAPALTLLLIGADGREVPIALGRPTAAFATACAAPLPVTPGPTRSPSRGS